MKTSITAIIFVLLLVVAASAQTQWSGYYSDEFQFRVSFPGDPKLFTQPLDKPTLKRYTYLVGNDDLAYMVMISDLHDSKTDASGHQVKVTGFDLNSPGLLQGMPNARLISQRSLTIDGVPGREFVEEKDELVIKIRMTYYLGRVYEVGAAVSRSLASDAATQSDITRFLDSFHFKNADLSSVNYQEGV